MEMTEFLQNCRFYSKIVSNNSKEVKKTNNQKSSKDFSVMTYVEKTSYFEVAPPGNTIIYKNVDNLLNHDQYIF